MKRYLLIAIILVGVMPSSAKALDDLHPCGRSSTGWYLYSGSQKTSCGFVRATYRHAKANQPLPYVFWMKVRGVRLLCIIRQGSNYTEIRCKGGPKRVIFSYWEGE